MHSKINMEQRNNINNKAVLLFLILILITAFCFRSVNIFYGLPNPGYFAPDEIDAISRALRMASGDFTLSHFNKPTFFNLALLGTYGEYFLLRKLLGLKNAREYFESLFIQNPTIFYFLARLISVISSVLTVFLCFKLGRKIKNTLSGLLAALILTFCFTTVKMAHFAKEDSLLTLLTVLAIFFSLEFLQTRKFHLLFLSAIAAGFGASAKYSGFFSLFFPLIASLLLFTKPRLYKFPLLYPCLIFILFLFCFGLGTPYFLLHPWKFLSQVFTSKIFAQLRGETIWLGGEPHFGANFIMKMFLQEYGLALSIFALFITLFFIFLLLRQKPNIFFPLTPDTLFTLYALLCFVLIQILIFSLSGHLDYHYLLPITPILTLFVSVFIVSIFRARPRLIPVIAALILIAEPGFRVLKFARETIGNDTRQLASEWIVNNISADEKIAFDTAYYYQYHPPINLSPEAIDVLTMEAELKGGGGAYFRLLKKYTLQQPQYQAKFLPMPTWLNPSFADEIKEYNLQRLKAGGFKYLICSSYYYGRIFKGLNPQLQPLRDFYLELSKKERLIKKFSPVSWKNMGPEILIYKLN